MEIQKITPKELHKRIKNKQNTFVLDVRAEDKFKDYHLDNSYNIPKSFIFEIEGNNANVTSSLPKHEEIVVTCTTGNSAMKCALILSEKDYKVTVLDGGITAWKEYLRTL